MQGQFKVHKDAKRYAAGLNHWRVDGKINGRRIREFFDTQEKAEERRRIRNIELGNHGHQAADIPSEWRIELAHNMPRLKSVDASLTDAVNFYLKHHDVRSRSVTVTEAWTDYRAAKQALVEAGQFRPRSLETTVKVCSDFAHDFAGELVYDITSDRIQSWLDGLKREDGASYASKSKETYRLGVSGFFSHCVKRNWLKEHPTKGDKVDSGYRINNTKRPGFFTVEEAAKLLEVADQEILPVVAIGLFAGLRPNEIHRLEWSEIHWHSKQIDVQAEKSKTAQYRFVPMSENLLQWLAPYRTTTGRVFSKSIGNMNKRVTAAAKAAGIATWPKDGLRHSYGSYYFAMSKSATETATHMGHEDTKMLFKHYNNRRSHAEGLAYFQIRPLAAQEAEKVQDLLAAA